MLMILVAIYFTFIYYQRGVQKSELEMDAEACGRENSRQSENYQPVDTCRDKPTTPAEPNTGKEVKDYSAEVKNWD